MASGESGGDEEVACAVCWMSTDTVLMPCCGKVGASTRFCLRCIEIICSHDEGHIGRCPQCRQHIVVEGASSRGCLLAPSKAPVNPPNGDALTRAGRDN